MNALFADANRTNEVRRLNLLWYSVLPGGAVVVMFALYAWTRTGAYEPPVIEESIAVYLPMILGMVLFSGIGLSLFLKSRLPEFVARSPAEQPFQRVSTAMFTLLGAADAPVFIGIGLYMVNLADWLVVVILFYAFAAGIIFKPDFGKLLAIERA